MSQKLSEISWTQKYRPPSIDLTILPNRIREEFKGGKIGTHYLFSGTSGIGKTTLALILAKGRSTLFLEAGVNTGINDIRDKVIPFASTASLRNAGQKKVAIIDESSELSIQAQKSLKSVIEKYEHNVIFILTANHPEKLDSNLKSRMTEVSFNFSDDEKREQIRQYADRIRMILKTEGNWKIEDSTLIKFLKHYYPDLRKMLNALYSICKTKNPGDTIVEADLATISSSTDEELYKTLIEGHNPHKIYQFVKTNYYGREINAIQALGTPFVEYLVANKKYDKALGVSVLAQKYMFEAKTGSIDLHITLLALCSMVSKLFKTS